MNWIVLVVGLVVAILAAVVTSRLDRRQTRREAQRAGRLPQEDVDVEQREIPFADLRSIVVSFYHGQTMETMYPYWVVDDQMIVFNQPLDTPMRAVVQGFDGEIIRTSTTYFHAPNDPREDRVGPNAKED